MNVSKYEASYLELLQSREDAIHHRMRLAIREANLELSEIEKERALILKYQAENQSRGSELAAGFTPNL